jgi:hypothetical protein
VLKARQLFEDDDGLDDFDVRDAVDTPDSLAGFGNEFGFELTKPTMLTGTVPLGHPVPGPSGNYTHARIRVVYNSNPGDGKLERIWITTRLIRFEDGKVFGSFKLRRRFYIGITHGEGDTAIAYQMFNDEIRPALQALLTLLKNRVFESSKQFMNVLKRAKYKHIPE